MKLDRIFIINLKSRKDRKIQIIKELHRVKAENYEFFEAIRPTEKELQSWNTSYINPLPKWFVQSKKDPLKYRLGALGCLKSHYEIIKLCKQRGYKNVLILEDDTQFTYKDVQAGIRQVNQNLLQTRQTLTTGSYIISEKAMDLILNRLNGYMKEIDVFYIEQIQSTIPCFVIYPHIAGQISSYSDIAQRQVNYNL